MNDPRSACFLSLVIPAFNEEAGIAQAIGEADDALRRLGRSYEILVIDDGSRDATAETARAACADRPNVRLLRHDANCGYGAALRTGFTAARGERIAFTDADCQFYLDDLADLLPLTETHAVAVGWRKGRQDSSLRRFCSRGYNLLTRTLLGTGVRDVDCALKVYRRDALVRLMPEAGDFFVNTEMLTRARQLGLTIAEVGVRHRPRLRGTSKVSPREVPRTLNALLPFWWSRVLFVGREPDAQARENTATPALQIALLLALLLMACTLFFARLDQPLLEPEEARYAEIPRQMLAEGRLLTPVLHGEDYFQKPPLLYWLVMASYKMFGVHDWAARLVPALAGVLTVLLTALWGWRCLGFWAGLAGGTVLCLSVRFLYLAGMLTMDGLLCLWVVAALAAGHLALAEPANARRWRLLAAVACGLGVLTKGPVAVVLIAAPLLGLAFLDRRCRMPTVREWLVSVLIVAVMALPWFVVMSWQAPRAGADFVLLHHLARYFAPLDHEQPAWYYLPSLFLGSFPWTLLLVPFVPYLLRRTPRAARRRPAALGFVVLAAVWCIAFFSLSGCKRQGYILPAFPLVALALGTFITHGLPWRRWLVPTRSPQPGYGQRVGHRLARRMLAATLALGIVLSWGALIAGLWSWSQSALSTLFLSGALIGLRWWEPERAAWRSWASCTVGVFVLLLVATHRVLPEYHAKYAMRSQVVPQKELEALPVACYPKRWDSVSFYLQREVELFAPAKAHGNTLLFVKREGALQELLRTLPDGYEFVPRGEPGRNVVVGVVRKKVE